MIGVCTHDCISIDDWTCSLACATESVGVFGRLLELFPLCTAALMSNNASVMKAVLD